LQSKARVFKRRRRRRRRRLSKVAMEMEVLMGR